MIAAKRYNVEIYDSVSDFQHGNSHIITEFYIPSMNVSFNYNDVLNTFEGNRMKDATNDVVDIELSQEMVDNVIRIHARKKEVDVLSKNVIDYINAI
jgi:hypothetical protein